MNERKTKETLKWVCTASGCDFETSNPVLSREHTHMKGVWTKVDL